MFKNILYILSATALLTGCTKNNLELPINAVTGGARIKLIHAAPDAPGVNLLIGGQKINGATPAGASSTNPGTPVPVVFGSSFPTGTGAGYAVVPAGQAAITLSAPASTTAGSATVVSQQNLMLDNDKNYSLLMAGTGATPEVIVLNDDLSQTLDPTKFYVRFINLTIGQNYDFGLSTGTILAPDLAYKGNSGFIPIDAALLPSFVMRLPKSSVNVVSLTFSSNITGRVLTVVARGTPGKTGTQAPSLIITVNR